MSKSLSCRNWAILLYINKFEVWNKFEWFGYKAFIHTSSCKCLETLFHFVCMYCLPRCSVQEFPLPRCYFLWTSVSALYLPIEIIFFLANWQERCLNESVGNKSSCDLKMGAKEVPKSWWDYETLEFQLSTLENIHSGMHLRSDTATNVCHEFHLIKIFMFG